MSAANRLFLLIVLALGVVMLAAPFVYMRWREERIVRFCKSTKVGESIGDVELRATTSGLWIDHRPEASNRHGLLEVGATPFPTLFTYCCVQHKAGTVIGTEYCSSG